MTAPMTSLDLFDRLLALDAALAARGFPRLSAWWRRTLRAFLRSGKRRLVLRVGRRGGKSLTLAKLAVVLALYAPCPVPPGERALIPWLSVDLREASSRLAQLRAMLDAIGARYEARGDEIALVDRAVTFRVYPASFRAVVGFSALAVFADEVSRWRDSESGANPAASVVSSIAPTLATTRGVLILASAPWSDSDFHAEQFDLGTTSEQMTGHAASWEANDTLDRTELRRLCATERDFLRDFGAVPSGEVSNPFEPGEVDALVTAGVEERPPRPERTYAAAFDAGMRKDRSALLIFHREWTDGPFGAEDVLVVDRIVHLVPRFMRPLDPEGIAREIVPVLRRYRVDRLHSDRHYADSFRPILERVGVRLVELPVDLKAQTARVEAFQARVTAGRLRLLAHAELLREIKEAQLHHRAGGQLTLSAPERRGRHDDLLDALLLAHDATVLRELPVSGGGGIEFKCDGHRFDDDGLHSINPRWVRVRADGTEERVGWPSWDPGFEDHVRELARQGITTRESEAYFRDQGIDPASFSGLTAPIRDHD